MDKVCQEARKSRVGVPFSLVELVCLFTIFTPMDKHGGCEWNSIGSQFSFHILNDATWRKEHHNWTSALVMEDIMNYLGIVLYGRLSVEF